jgi:hypothetical protein
MVSQAINLAKSFCKISHHLSPIVKESSKMRCITGRAFLLLIFWIASFITDVSSASTRNMRNSYLQDEAASPFRTVTSPSGEKMQEYFENTSRRLQAGVLEDWTPAALGISGGVVFLIVVVLFLYCCCGCSLCDILMIFCCYELCCGDCGEL